MCVQNQYSGSRHICSGLLLNHDPNSTFVMAMTGYSLYMDAAGHPSDKPHIVVAGFVASESAWVRFEPAWDSALKRNGIESPFHMVDFEYRRRRDPRHDEIITDLVKTISDYALAAIACTVAMDDYRNVNEHWPLEEGMGKPYSITARGAFRNALNWQSSNRIQGKMLPFVESGTLHEGDMCKCFLRDELPEPIPVSKGLAPAQAADLLAWEVARYNRTQQYSHISRTIGNAFPYPERQLFGTYPRKRMRIGMEESGLPKRKDLPPNHDFRFWNLPKEKRKRQIL